MAKTVKYEMYINTFNMMGNIIPLSKKVFMETLNNYKKQVDESRDGIEEYSDEDNKEWVLDEMNVSVKDFEHYTETLYSFNDEGTAICLKKSEAKDGYYWK